MDSAKYGKVLTQHMIPSARRLIGRGYIFMQDNASCHKSKATQTLLRNRKVNLLPHPAQSPDLNPIETLWEKIDDRLKPFKPRNIEELWQTIQTVWNSLEVNLLDSLVESMPNRCGEVIKSKGFPTKY